MCFPPPYFWKICNWFELLWRLHLKFVKVKIIKFIQQVKQLGMADTKWFLTSFNRSNLQYEVHGKKSKGSGLNDIIAIINSKWKKKCGIVYCFSRYGYDYILGDVNRTILYFLGTSILPCGNLQWGWSMFFLYDFLCYLQDRAANPAHLAANLLPCLGLPSKSHRGNLICFIHLQFPQQVDIKKISLPIDFQYAMMD